VLALLGAFVAGVLTTLSPCHLALLPVILGGAVSGSTRRALVVVASLGVSVVAFTLLLKVSTALLDIPESAWRYLSGGILVGLGIVTVFPGLWDRLSMRLSLESRAAAGLSSARGREGVWGQVLTGAALGPVFSSCSPFYAYVIVTVLPAEVGRGLVLLAAYVVGMCGMVLLVVLLGRRLIDRMGWATNPEGWFRRGVGLVFVAVGVMIITGLDKSVMAWFIQTFPDGPWTVDSGFIPAQS